MKKYLLLLLLLLPSLRLPALFAARNAFGMAPAVASDEWTAVSSHLIDSLQLPPDTKLAAEAENLQVFTHVDSIYADDMDAVSLWIYRPQSGQLLKLLQTNPRVKYECLGLGNRARRVSVDSIPTIDRVFINIGQDKLLIEGWDCRNSYVYIVHLTPELPTFQVPCSAGILGLTSEEDLIVAQSYAYYKMGGRYSELTVHDWQGNTLKYLVLKNLSSKMPSYATLYQNQIEACRDKYLKKISPGHSEYFLEDMNNDRIPELFVKTGTCEADYELDVYTVSNGKVKHIYHTHAGHRDFYRGKDYLLMVEAQSDEFASFKLTMPNGKIKEELLVRKDPATPMYEFDYPEYTEPQIEFHFEDMQPLKDAFDVFSAQPANR